MENILRPVWNKVFNFNWKFGLFLILLFCLPRFVLVLDANATKNYSYIGLVMVVSALAPFIFLTRKGLKEIGITKPKHYRWLLIGFSIGLILSLLFFYLEIIYTEIPSIITTIILAGHTISLMISVEMIRSLCS